MSENFLGQKPKRSGAPQASPLHDIVENITGAIWKRKWFVIPPVFFGTALGILLALYIRPQYKSSTLILIEPQQVPSSYVKPTDTTPVQARLNTLQQQIMSRTKLEKIIREYDPYKVKTRKGWRGTIDGLFEKNREPLGGGREGDGPLGGRALLSNAPRRGITLEEVKRMRKDIKVKITGGRARRSGSVAFSISYAGTSPQTIMEVTNAIAGLYIEENLKLREQYAEGTSDFLRTELKKAENELKRQENEVKVFKERNLGTLPGQLQANLHTLDRLQLDVQAAQAEIKDLKEEKTLLLEQLANEEERKKEYARHDAEDSVEVPAGPTELERLRESLNNLLSLYKENYPDVIMARHRIKDLEAKEKADAPALPKTPQTVRRSKSKFLQISEDSIEVFRSRIRSVNYRIAKMKGSVKDLAKKVRKYEKRVEDTPKSEQTLADILRNYEISRKNYDTLLDKKMNANMAESMEKRQKGERFRVVDPANLPEKPVKPNRILLVAMGVFVGGLASGAILFFLEFYKAVYRKTEDVYADLQVPVLASIPLFKKGKKSEKVGSIQATAEAVFGKTEGLDAMVIEQYYVLFTKIVSIARKNEFSVFAITSAVQGEGKTETSHHLAYVIAKQFKKRVILVDCDLRKTSPFFSPTKGKRGKGLSDVIRGRIDLVDAVIPVGGSSLSVLPSMARRKSSLQLLDSHAFTDLISRLKEEYDYVILDSPPSLFLADVDIIAKKSDAVLYVVRAGSTPKNVVSKGIHSFDHKISGIILNGVDNVVHKKYFQEYD